MIAITTIMMIITIMIMITTILIIMNIKIDIDFFPNHGLFPKAQWCRLVRPGQLRWGLPGGRRSGRGGPHGERHRSGDDHPGDPGAGEGLGDDGMRG